jgi:hypothetical protein
MNFKHYIQLREEPLPGLGLVRTYRDTYRNEKSYQKAKYRRDAFCFHNELNKRCNIYKEYKRECYKMIKVRRVLCNGLPEDVVRYLLEFYSVQKIEFIQRINYYGIYPKEEYKWYILISNILYTMKEEYHQNVLNLYKELPIYNYNDTFLLLLKGIGKQKKLLEEGLYFECESDSIFDIASEYKKYLDTNLYYMYYNIRL